MNLTDNLQLDRLEWAIKKATEVIQNHYPNKSAIHYDVGAGASSLVKKIGEITASGSAFDLFPVHDSIRRWNIEETFPYSDAPAHIVTFLEIVEHLNNPWQCMKNLAAAIAPGGYLIMTTPNPGWSTSRLNLLAKGYLTCFTRSDLELNHHVFTAWPHIVERLLRDNGFEIVEYVTLDGKTRLFDDALKASSALFQLPVRAMKKLIERRDPTSIGMSYGILAKKIA